MFSPLYQLVYCNGQSTNQLCERCNRKDYHYLVYKVEKRSYELEASTRYYQHSEKLEPIRKLKAKYCVCCVASQFYQEYPCYDCADQILGVSMFQLRDYIHHSKKYPCQTLKLYLDSLDDFSDSTEETEYSYQRLEEYPSQPSPEY